MADEAFARLVALGCHDLRTPLATVNGFAKTLIEQGELAGREARFVEMIDEAAGQMTGLLDDLGLAARIAAGRYEPVLVEVDTLELASSPAGRILTLGRGEAVETDAGPVRRGLEALALAAARYGGVASVTWTVTGREFLLAPLTADAVPVVTGESPRDLGALVARMAIERLGGTLTVAGEALRVLL